jgi:5-methylcytosine-specific restriction endonuclease McrA
MSIRAAGKQTLRWAKQTVLTDDPPTTAAAAMVLLSRKLFLQDRTVFTESRMLRFRTRWMKEQMKTPDEKGGLTCAICGRKGLNPFTKDKNKLATLDHIVELKANGAAFDTSNFQIACYRCNGQKSATPAKCR